MNSQKPIVLLSMLNWGMGHVTRCFPLIHSLLKLKKSLLIVCTAQQRDVLEKTFADLRYYIASDNMPIYGKSKLQTLINLSLQAPSQFLKIRKNKKLVSQLAQLHSIELIISDNKYGFYHPEIPSIIITHQLNIKSGWGNLFDKLINRLNYFLLKKFDEIWVLDNEGDMSLAGELSKNKYINLPCKWIGPFNRLQSHPKKGSKKIVIILSGPEPQRTILEETIVNQLHEVDYNNIVLIRGTQKKLSDSANIILQNLAFHDIIDLAGVTEIDEILGNAEWVIGRSGYTSLMEWICGGWKSITIPTPGQAEQEYLAMYNHQKGWTYSIDQERFHLQQCIKNAAVFHYNDNRPTAAGYSEINQFIVSILSKSGRHIG